MINKAELCSTGCKTFVFLSGQSVPITDSANALCSVSVLICHAHWVARELQSVFQTLSCLLSSVLFSPFHFVHQWLPTPVLTLLTKSTEAPALRLHLQRESRVWPVSLIGNGGLSCDWKGYETLRRFSLCWSTGGPAKIQRVIILAVNGLLTSQLMHW